MIPLKYNTTSQEVILGPFLDDTDGKTAETALSIANTDIKLWKSGATTEANKNSGGATHIASGRYYAELDATDTDTYGPMEINVHMAGALPIKVRCLVMNADAYDALFSASSGSVRSNVTVMAANVLTASALATDAVTEIQSGLATQASVDVVDAVADAIKLKTDNLPSDPADQSLIIAATDALATLIGDVPTNSELATALASADDAVLAQIALVKTVTDALPDAGALSSLATAAALATVDGIADAILVVANKLDDTLEDDGGLYRFTTNALEQAPGGSGASPHLMVSTTIATLASQTSFTLTAGSADNDAYNGAIAVVIDQSTNTQRCFATIADYAGSTKTVTLGGDPGIFTMAVGDTIYIMTPLGAAGSAPTAAAIRAEIDANSTKLADIVADTNELQQDWANGGRLDLLLDGVKGKTDNLPTDPADQSLIIAATDALATAIGSLNNLSSGNVETAVGVALTAYDAATGTDVANLQQCTIKKGSTEKFTFEMVLSVDKTLADGLTVTGKRSLDGGAWASVTGSVTEIGEGSYYFTPNTADSNANEEGIWKFSAADCDDFIFHFKTSD